jgi:hypothetical protein
MAPNAPRLSAAVAPNQDTSAVLGIGGACGGANRMPRAGAYAIVHLGTRQEAKGVGPARRAVRTP